MGTRVCFLSAGAGPAGAFSSLTVPRFLGTGVGRGLVGVGDVATGCEAVEEVETDIVFVEVERGLARLEEDGLFTRVGESDWLIFDLIFSYICSLIFFNRTFIFSVTPFV